MLQPPRKVRPQVPKWKRKQLLAHAGARPLGELDDETLAELSRVPDVAEREIGVGFAANLQTASMIREIARLRSTDPRIRALALSIVKGVPSHDYLGEARAIGEFVQKQVRYVRDIAGVEQIHDPLLMLKKLVEGKAQGDCDDMVLFAATLMLSIGCAPLMRVVKYRPEFLSWNHIYLVVYEKPGARRPRERLVVDCIVKDHPIGYEIPHASGEELPFL